MENVAMEVKGKTLTITVDLTAKGHPSTSGKTDILASTHGNAAVVDPKGQTVYVGLNVYRRKT